MPPRKPILSVPDYPRHLQAINQKWADLIKSDPLRVCRVLTLPSPKGETVEGDTFDDIPLIFDNLLSVAKESTEKTWKGLVEAGIVTSLCKWAINAEQLITKAYMFMNDQGIAELSQEAMDYARDNAPGPYTPALEILCNAACSCAVPPTSTEQKMIEELKKNWPTMMQRIWSDPSLTLEPGSDPRRMRERVIVAQIAHRIAFVDPTFLDVILKPSDLTLAVAFRYWLYSTDTYDAMANGSLISPLLGTGMPKHWEEYFKEHPPPDLRALLPRILLGSSRGTERKKRTPNQAAEFIVSVFPNHFRNLSGRFLMEEIILFIGLFAAAGTYAPLCRAVFRSEALWSAFADVMKRYGKPELTTTEGPPPQSIALQVLSLYNDVARSAEQQGCIDTLVYNWLEGGLFDALDASIATIIHTLRGPVLISLLLSTLDNNLTKLSPKTRKKLKSELPRPITLVGLILLATKGNPDLDLFMMTFSGAESIIEQAPMAKGDPQHPVWALAPWQVLVRITHTLRPWRYSCTRRGCENPAYTEGCTHCGVSPFCDTECLRKDDEHKFICPFTRLLTLMAGSLRHKKEEREAIIADGVAPRPEGLAVSTPEELLQRMRESGNTPKEVVDMLADMHLEKKSAEEAGEKQEEIPSIIKNLQEAIEQLHSSDRPSTAVVTVT
ncbi:hypothetical protein C8Q70DRAFT_1050807 [Cubamyces menziesii]|uniref:MYND-type domain-containing protein n=1 Tax=Trametes cubensis TaxID=1111947 RepID=A0AAD7TWU5_9APHY|nr:hypothetical protein C8Q70DRAFT_1050807 [Cubamyces menziesii]KAJ8487508.1 hypothetical protein ONZ51_g4134 [Trametes cubensis]